MKFLIDECLHTSLAQLCWDEGHEAYHVAHRGLSGAADRDFLRMFALQEAHSGLVIILPNVPPPLQATLFRSALQDITTSGEPFNQVVEVDFDGAAVVVRRFDLSA